MNKQYLAETTKGAMSYDSGVSRGEIVNDQCQPNSQFTLRFQQSGKILNLSTLAVGFRVNLSAPLANGFEFVPADLFYLESIRINGNQINIQSG
jgi:hypothetical protein